jgi:hypothetical protein
MCLLWEARCPQVKRAAKPASLQSSGETDTAPEPGRASVTGRLSRSSFVRTRLSAPLALA